MADCDNNANIPSAVTSALTADHLLADPMLLRGASYLCRRMSMHGDMPSAYNNADGVNIAASALVTAPLQPGAHLPVLGESFCVVQVEGHRNSASSYVRKKTASGLKLRLIPEGAGVDDAVMSEANA